MKTVTLSNRFYYRELEPQDARAIKNDILLYNRMIHKAYKLLTLKFQGIPWNFDSLQKEMKRLYSTNDYFPLSVIWKAKHMLKGNYEQHKKAVQQKQHQLKRIDSKTSESSRSDSKNSCLVVKYFMIVVSEQANYINKRRIGSNPWALFLFLDITKGC